MEMKSIVNATIISELEQRNKELLEKLKKQLANQE